MRRVLTIIAVFSIALTIGRAPLNYLEGGIQEGPKAAGCPPSSGLLNMNYNAVFTIIETAGLLWNDRQNGDAGYWVPRTAPAAVIYAGGLWMGGEDINGNLKVAAVQFRQGNDYWTGPLTVTPGTGNYDPSVSGDFTLRRDYGPAEITPETCEEYDKMFTMQKSWVTQFVAWFECSTGQSTNCDDVTQPSDQIMNAIINWPATVANNTGQDEYLAPFYDNPNAPDGDGADGIYDPEGDGDYPWYDLNEEIDCRNDRRITLFGDQTNWWVFNDKGNIHTESNGQPIGMEIRAQAFSFATNDEINQMSFYNYELINRSTQTLSDTYFAQYCDADIGGSNDDYVGCDVGRGLGFIYNGDLVDDAPAGGEPTWGDNPPAVGIDFFEGPYQDPDGVDNAIGIGAGEALNGIGYGDGTIDNERYGMRRFLYFTRPDLTQTPGINGDPEVAADFYNLMTGFWKNASRMKYGGTGIDGGTGTTAINADFMFPGTSDTANWGTAGIDPGFPWDESTENNPAADRRFVQAAGPFVLDPGAVNNITVGVVYGRSFDGDLEASVREVKRADTKAQALFDNCFQLVEPPYAPYLTLREMENEIIIYLSGTDEAYFERDKINIVQPDPNNPTIDDTFKFEGYQIYQLADAAAGVSDIGDVTKARLVAQCDVQNGVGRLINYIFDEELQASIPTLMVDGADEGIFHSLSVKNDLFASGANTLVNNKKYYYVGVSYAYNNFKTYDPTDPLALDGQKEPYLRSRQLADGSAITPVIGIPHSNTPERSGTVWNSQYGDVPGVTRLSGTGSGDNLIEISSSQELEILNSNTVEKVTYITNNSPVAIKIVDPLTVAPGDYNLIFYDYSPTNSDLDNGKAKWRLTRNYDGIIDTVLSDTLINVINEQLIPEWGISVEIEQVPLVSASGLIPEVMSTSMVFSDSSKQWLIGIPDDVSNTPFNWINIGSNIGTSDDPIVCNDADVSGYNPCCYEDKVELDDYPLYSDMIGGTWSMAKFARIAEYNTTTVCPAFPLAGNSRAGQGTVKGAVDWSPAGKSYHSVDIVITSDKSKWSRVPVIEMGDSTSLNEGTAEKWTIRQSPSVNKEGDADGTGTGMGWFPGYAIDIETGQRLNMAFGENSKLVDENGRDMLWNPTASFYDDFGNPLFGGMHYIYVFGVNNSSLGSIPAYDEGATLQNVLTSGGLTDYQNMYRDLRYVGMPVLTPGGSELFETDVRVKIRMKTNYQDLDFANNGNRSPEFEFSLDGYAPKFNDASAYDSVQTLINVVPNPYNGVASYETSRTDTRIKITNLPEQCRVRIYNSGGTLVREYQKDDATTYIEWDLKNYANIPIASGVYLIHVRYIDENGNNKDVIVKWFGTMRTPDLQNI